MITATTLSSIDNLSEGVPSVRNDTAAPVVLDFGKQKRKAVKQLRQGTGKLIEEVSAALDELRSAGTIQAGAQPVIIIVQQKRRRQAALFPGL